MSRQTEPIRFTAAVVTCNEADKLADCLASLQFADELVVIDLESRDDPSPVAHRWGAELRTRTRVPVVEEIRGEIADAARHDWVIFLDPDERMPPGAGEALAAAIRQQPDLASVRLPCQFHFGKKPLTTTVWGRGQERTVLVHRRRVRLSPDVHRGIQPLPGHPVVTLPRHSPDFAVQHLWVDSWRDLFAKHRRYLSREGKSLHAAGHRFSWRRALHRSAWALKHSLFDCRGWAGGPRGLALSLFFAGYTWTSWMSLRRHETTL